MSSINGLDDHDRKTDCMTLATVPFIAHSGNKVVDSFRVREYSQLAGKVYLDHGGSTVSIFTHTTAPTDISYQF